LITEMAKKYKDDHKTDEAKAKEEIRDKMARAESKTHGATVNLINVLLYFIVDGVKESWCHGK